jgi:hypothetical protein
MTSAASPATRSATATSRKALNITLWVLQVLLAGFFVMVGYSHALLIAAPAAFVAWGRWRKAPIDGLLRPL